MKDEPTPALMDVQVITVWAVVTVQPIPWNDDEKVALGAVESEDQIECDDSGPKFVPVRLTADAPEVGNTLPDGEIELMAGAV